MLTLPTRMQVYLDLLICILGWLVCLPRTCVTVVTCITNCLRVAQDCLLKYLPK